jgi:hypothetical protein
MGLRSDSICATIKKYKMSSAREPQLRTRHRPVYAASVAKCASVALIAPDYKYPAKPDPSALQAIAPVWGCELRPELVMVGDSPTHDAGAGHKSGYLASPGWNSLPIDQPEGKISVRDHVQGGPVLRDQISPRGTRWRCAHQTLLAAMAVSYGGWMGGATGGRYTQSTGR